jgi:hypothetical protein
MIEPTFEMIPRALYVLLVVHLICVVVDFIRLRTTYYNTNRRYYWKSISLISGLICFDILLSIIAFSILAVWYILTGEIL